MWGSGESARLPPMCPGSDFWTRRQMWIEFVVGSHHCSEGFSPSFLFFFPPQKPSFLNSNSIGNSRAMGLSVEDCCVLSSLNKVHSFMKLLMKCFKLDRLSSQVIADIALVLIFFCLTLLKICC